MAVERDPAFAAGRDAASAAPHSEAARRLLQRPLSDDELVVQTAEVARRLEEDTGRRISLLVFECGGERLAIHGSVVGRVTLPAIVHRVPHRSNAVLRGICNLDGQLVLVGDLAALLDLDGSSAPSDSRDRRMLLLGESPEQWAVEVDRVIGVFGVDPDRLLDPPATVGAARDHLTEHLVEIDVADGGDGTERMALLSGERLLAGLGRGLA